MRKILIVLLIGVVSAMSTDDDYTKLVCFSDNTGRTVMVGGADTSLVLKEVVLIVLKDNAYNVTTKNGNVTRYPKPNFSYVQIFSKDKK